MRTETRKRLIILLRILIVISILVAWGHSLMSLPASQKESGLVLKALKPVFKAIMPGKTITDYFIRKLAHFSEFCIMGLEMTMYLQLSQGIKPKLLVNTLLSGLFIAFIDESIQMFTGRGPLISDLWIDLAGFTLGGLIMCLAVFIWHRLKGKGKEEEASDQV